MAADRARRLSRHFVLGDFLVDDGFPELARALEPGPEALRNLERLAGVLDLLVERFPGGWKVVSGFRDDALNEACRAAGFPASLGSLHLDGCAADLEPVDPEVDLEAVFEWVREGSRRALAVHEAVFYPQKGHLHVAVESPRRATPKRILMRT
jgi:hypothetical protein